MKQTGNKHSALYLHEQVRKVAYHITLWIVALSILNTSIDITETLPITFPNHPSPQAAYDEIESIVELVITEASGNTQHLPDSTSNDQRPLLKKTAAFDFTLPVRKLSEFDLFIHFFHSTPGAQNDTASLAAGHTDITTPPPDIA